MQKYYVEKLFFNGVEIKGDLYNRVLDIELEDDKTPFGGIAYSGETLGDYLDSQGKRIVDLKDVNEWLVESGIKRITGFDELLGHVPGRE